MTGGGDGVAAILSAGRLAADSQDRAVLDLRGLLQVLEARGELRRIRRAVDRGTELPALMGLVDREQRAYLFEQVVGARFPLAGGLLNRYEAYGWALGVPQGEPFGRHDLDRRIEAARRAPLPPREVDRGPAQERELAGEALDLGTLPIPTMFEMDTGPFITGAVGVVRDPVSGVQNVGMYRTLVLGRDRLSVNASGSSDLKVFYEAAAREGRKLPIALALGVEPAVMMASVCKLPRGQCEFDLAGALRGRPLELVRCRTSDLQVPAGAEIVIEAEVDPASRVGNTFGEWAGLYGPDQAPVARVTAITHRSDAIAYAILGGRNPEHTTLASVTAFEFQRVVGEALRRALPAAVDVHVFAEHELGSMLHVVLSHRKSDEESAMRLARAAFQVPVTMGPVPVPCERVVKRVIVVDPDVDVRDRGDVEWALWTRTARADKYLVLGEAQSWDMERCAKPGRGSLRLAIDATSDLEDRDKLRRATLRGGSSIRLADYLAG